jgi:membrane fusion protein (multidrug efflux system)
MSSYEMNLVSEFYHSTRCTRSATKMMTRTFLGMLVLCLWSGLTPIDETVMESVSIVPDMADKAFDSISQKPDATLSGPVTQVCIAEDQVVKKGDLILRIDAEETGLKIESLEKRIAAALKEARLEKEKLALQEENYLVEREGFMKSLENARTQIRLSEQRRKIQIKQAQISFDLAKKMLLRSKKLKSQNAISQLELDQMSSDYADAKEQLALASLPIDESGVDEIQASLNRLRSKHDLNVHESRIRSTAFENELEQLNSDKRILERTMASSDIRSPCDGVVTSCEVKMGDWIGPGELPITISPAGFMIEAMIPSNSIGGVEAGNAALISIDGIDWMLHGQISGSVVEVSSDVVQEETVTGNGTARPVSGYRVLIELEKKDGFDAWDQIRLGMTGTAEIQTGQKRLAFYLFEKAFGRL